MWEAEDRETEEEAEGGLVPSYSKRKSWTKDESRWWSDEAEAVACAATRTRARVRSSLIFLQKEEDAVCTSVEAADDPKIMEGREEVARACPRSAQEANTVITEVKVGKSTAAVTHVDREEEELVNAVFKVRIPEREEGGTA